MVDVVEPELLLELEPLLEPELGPESGVPPEPEPPLEPEPLLEPELELFWNAIVPVTIGLMLCGVTVNVFPEAQYEYIPPPPMALSTLPAVVYMPPVAGLLDTNPIPPIWFATVPEQLHPPPLAASVHVSES